MNAIYLISANDAVRTDDEQVARNLERLGYRRCSMREYVAQKAHLAQREREAAFEQHRRLMKQTRADRVGHGR